jgi:hypothetical protein
MCENLDSSDLLPSDWLTEWTSATSTNIRWNKSAWAATASTVVADFVGESSDN